MSINAEWIIVPGIDLVFVMVEVLDYSGRRLRPRIDPEQKVSRIARPKAPIVVHMYVGKGNVQAPLKRIEFVCSPVPIPELVHHYHRIGVVVSGKKSIQLPYMISDIRHRRLRR
jgi:hypothetical protein